MKFTRTSVVEAIFSEPDESNLDEVVKWAKKNNVRIPEIRREIPLSKWLVSTGDGFVEYWDDKEFRNTHARMERVIVCNTHRVTVYNKVRKIQHLGCDRRTMWIP